MNAGGAFVAGAIVSKLLLDKSGWTEAVRSVEKDMTGIEARGAKTGAQITTLGKQIATVGIAVAGAFTAIAVQTMKYGETLYDLSQKTGVSAELLSSFKLAAEQSGSSLEGVATAFKFLSRNMASGNEAFAKMGVSIKDTQGILRPMAEVMVEVSERFKQMPDGAEKSALALAIFGRSGSELIPMLNLGAKGMDQAMKKARELGLVMTDETAKAADDFGDRLVELKGSMQGISMSIGKMLLPAASSLTKALTSVVSGITRAVEGSGELGKGLATTIPIWGLLVAAVGTAMTSIGILIRGLSLLSATLGTTKLAIMATTAAWTAAAAALIYYLSLLSQLEDAKERQRASELSLAEQQGKGIAKLQEAARQAGMTSAAMDTFIDKFKEQGDGYVGLALKAAQAGEAGVEVAAAMAAMAEKNREAWAKIHPEIDTYGKEIQDILSKYQQLSKTKITEELAAAEAELKRLQASTESTPGAIGAVVAKIKELTTALHGVKADPLERLQSGASRLKESWESLTAAWGKNIDEIIAGLNRLDDAVGIVEVDIDEAMAGWMAEGELAVQSAGITTSEILSEFTTSGEQLVAAASEKAREAYQKMKGGMVDLSSAFQGLYNDIATGFGDALQGMFEGTKKFADGFKSIWESIKKTFFRILGEMVVGFIMSFVKKIIAGMSLIKAVAGSLDLGGALLGGAGAAAAGAFAPAGGAAGVFVTQGGSLVSIPAAEGIGAAGAGSVGASLISSWAVPVAFAAVWLGTLYGTLFGKTAADKWEDSYVAEMKKKYGQDWAPQLRQITSAQLRAHSLTAPPEGFRGPRSVDQNAAIRTESKIEITINAFDGPSVDQVVREKVIPILRRAAAARDYRIPMGSAGGT